MFQLQILCSIVVLKALRTRTPAACHLTERAHLRPGHVYKLSRRPTWLQNETIFFASTTTAGDQGRHGLPALPVYTQIYEDVVRCPFDELRHYTELFDLSKADVHEVRAHLRFWDVLRTCCWALPATLRDRHGCASWARDATPPLLANPACNVYDFHQLELGYAANSPLYNLTLGGGPSLQL